MPILIHIYSLLLAYLYTHLLPTNLHLPTLILLAYIIVYLHLPPTLILVAYLLVHAPTTYQPTLTYPHTTYYLPICPPTSYPHIYPPVEGHAAMLADVKQVRNRQREICTYTYLLLLSCLHNLPTNSK